MTAAPNAAPGVPDHEFGFELRVCRWAEHGWPPDRDRTEPIVVARQLGTRRRRWDTVVIEADPEGLRRRARFGAEPLDSDLLHVVRNAPVDWEWYRDALPHPGYPWRYVREAVHRAADRGVVQTRRSGNRIELMRRWAYPDWVERIVAVENKPDLDASAARALVPQLERDVAAGLADEVWVATRATDRRVEPVLLEALPDAAGLLALSFSDREPADGEAVDGAVAGGDLDPPDPADVVWYPRGLDVDGPGIRILDRSDRAVRFEYVSAAETAATRLELAERAYGRGWRSYVETMRPDCASFELRRTSTRGTAESGAVDGAEGATAGRDARPAGQAAAAPAYVPHCTAKGCEPSAAECSGACPSFSPEPPAWRQRGWPIDGGPGRAVRELLESRRRRRRPGLDGQPDGDG